MRRFFIIATFGLLCALLPSVDPAGATPPADVIIEVETSLVGGVSPFTASGAALDEGIVCASGTVADEVVKAVGFSPLGFNVQAIKNFQCEDGSGDFSVNLEARIDFRRGVTFQWNVLSGTGDYADLHGAGSGVGLPAVPCGDPDACILDVYDGGLHID